MKGGCWVDGWLWLWIDATGMCIVLYSYLYIGINFIHWKVFPLQFIFPLGCSLIYNRCFRYLKCFSSRQHHHHHRQQSAHIYSQPINVQCRWFSNIGTISFKRWRQQQQTKNEKWNEKQQETVFPMIWFTLF